MGGDRSELDLRAIIDATPRLDELSAARVICQLATSVAAAKGGPTELSPEAIRIKPDGTIDVAFGKLVLAYASPEKVKNLATDRRSDVFSLGIVLWEALAHVRLFDGATDDAVGTAITTGEIVAPSQHNANVPAELDAICKKALARDPADRYPSPKVMAAELEAVLDDADYPDDNSRLATFVQKALAQKPKLPAPKVAPKLPTTPPINTTATPLPSIVARPSGTNPPPTSSAPSASVTLPGMPPVRPATIPPPVAIPQAVPIVPAPPVLPTGSADNLRSTVIGTPAPPGLEELAKTMPFAREPAAPEVPAVGMIAGLGAMPGLDQAPVRPTPVPKIEIAAPAPLTKIEPVAAAAVEPEPEPDDESEADEPAVNPVDAVSLRPPTHQGGDMLSRWAWQSDSMTAIQDDDEHHPPPNRKLLLYAIGGAVGLVLIVIIIAFAAGGSKKEPEVVADKPAEFKPSVAAGTEPPPPPPVPAHVDPVTPPAPPPPPEPVTPEVAPPPIDAAVAAIEPPAPPTPPPPPPEIKKVEPPPPEIKKVEPPKPPEVVKKKPEPKKVEPKKAEPKKAEPKKVATGPVDPYAEPVKKIDPAEAYRTGLQQYMRGDTNGALATFKASMQANSNYAPTYRGLGLVYEKLGNHAAARNAFKRYLALAPSASDADNIRERMEKL